MPILPLRRLRLLPHHSPLPKERCLRHYGPHPSALPLSLPRQQGKRRRRRHCCQRFCLLPEEKKSWKWKRSPTPPKGMTRHVKTWRWAQRSRCRVPSIPFYKKAPARRSTTLPRVKTHRPRTERPPARCGTSRPRPFPYGRTMVKPRGRRGKRRRRRMKQKGRRPRAMADHRPSKNENEAETYALHTHAGKTCMAGWSGWRRTTVAPPLHWIPRDGPSRPLRPHGVIRSIRLPVPQCHCRLRHESSMATQHPIRCSPPNASGARLPSSGRRTHRPCTPPEPPPRAPPRPRPGVVGVADRGRRRVALFTPTRNVRRPPRKAGSEECLVCSGGTKETTTPLLRLPPHATTTTKTEEKKRLFHRPHCHPSPFRLFLLVRVPLRWVHRFLYPDGGTCTPCEGGQQRASPPPPPPPPFPPFPRLRRRLCLRQEEEDDAPPPPKKKEKRVVAPHPHASVDTLLFLPHRPPSADAPTRLPPPPLPLVSPPHDAFGHAMEKAPALPAESDDCGGALPTANAKGSSFHAMCRPFWKMSCFSSPDSHRFSPFYVFRRRGRSGAADCNVGLTSCIQKYGRCCPDDCDRGGRSTSRENAREGEDGGVGVGEGAPPPWPTLGKKRPS